MKLLFLFIFLFFDYGIIIGNETIIKAESFPPEGIYFQKTPFYFLKNIPPSIKLFSGADLSFFRDQSVVDSYRYRIEIPAANATAIDRSLTRWSPWLSYDFIEIIIPVLDIEGGYKLIIEYKKIKSDEILRFEKVFYVYRLVTGSLTEPVKSLTPEPKAETEIQVSVPVSKAPEKKSGMANGSRLPGMMPSKSTIKPVRLPMLEKVNLDPKNIDIQKLYATSGYDSEKIRMEVSVGISRKTADNLDTVRMVNRMEDSLYNDRSEDRHVEVDQKILLEEAIVRKDLELVKHSIRSGSGRSIRGGEGGNLFHLLDDFTSDDELVRMLIEDGISLNEYDDNGNSPLHLAIFNHQNNYAGLLISKGADLNLKNKLDLSPLHIASMLDNRRIVDELIINGADVNIKGNTNYTPLLIASELNYLNLARDLLRKGANPKMKTSQGLNSRQIALIQKSKEMSRLMGGKNEVLPYESESGSSLTIASISMKKLNPINEFNLPYDNDLIKKRRINKIIGMASVPVFALSSAGVALLKGEADSFYSSYRNAETSDMARHYYDKTLQYDSYTYITAGVSLISVYGIIHSIIRKKSIDLKLYKLLY